MIGEKRSGIYEIKCVVNGHRYIGSSCNMHRRRLLHLSELKRGVHHSQILQRAWAKHGSDSFSFNVLEFISEENLCEREDFWMSELSCEYNIKPNGTPGWRGMRHTEESKKKISNHALTNNAAKEHLASIQKRKIGTSRSEETKAKMRLARLGTKHSQETIEKLRHIAAASGYRHSEETRARMSAGRRGIRPSQDSIERMRKSLTGRKLTAEHVANMSAARTGAVRTQATKDKISAAKRAKFAERKAQGLPAFKTLNRLG